MVNLYIFNEAARAAIYGIGTYIRELTATLKDSDINVCVVHLNFDKEAEKVGEAEEMGEIGNIRHLHIPSPISWSKSLNFNRQRELYYKNVVYLLRLQIKDTENLVFHLNFHVSEKLPEELKKAFDCRIVSAIHYFEWCLSLSGNITRLRKHLTSIGYEFNDKMKSVVESCQKEKKCFEFVDHIICLSENSRQILQNDYQIKSDKISVIYNGLSGNESIQNKQLLRKIYNVPDMPIILFAGRLDDIKGLSFALQAFKKVLKMQENGHFIIAGNGLFDTYMKECEDIWTHVTWTGLINRDKLYDLYSIADIGIMPSFHEQCSFVAIEMMMHGIPLISSTSTGLKEMIIDRETGLHIPVIEYDDRAEIDTELLAEKMLYLLQHPDERKRMGTNARKRYETVYSAEIFRQNMLDFYRSILKY